MTGCNNFFIPVCQAYNTCTTTTTTTTTTGTGTTGTGTTGTGTTGTSGTTASRQVSFGSGASSAVYVGNPLSSSIQAYALQSGRLTNLEPAGYPLASPPSAVAADATGHRLYVATSAGPVYLYNIAQDGTLQVGNRGNPAATVNRPTSLAMDRTGRWLFVASASSRRFQEFQIDPATGSLTLVAGARTRLDAGNLAQLYVAPNNELVAAALGKGGVDEFSLDAGSGGLGARTHVMTPKSAQGADTALAFNGASSLLFVAETGSGIRVLTQGAAGATAEIAGSPFATPQGAYSALALDPAGKHLYAASANSTTIAGYSVGARGALRAMPGSTYAVPASPAALLMDPTGRYLLAVSNGNGNNLQLYRMAAGGGSLQAVPAGATGAAGTQNALTVAP